MSKEKDENPFADWWQSPPSPPPSQRPLTAEGIYSLAEASVSEEEIAAFFGMDEKQFTEYLTENPRIKGLIDLAPKAGKAALRRRQFQLAVRGDDKMLKHLGEHTLGQGTKIEHSGSFTMTMHDVLESVDGKTTGLPNK